MKNKDLYWMRFYSKIRSRATKIVSIILSFAVRCFSAALWPIRKNIVTQTGQYLHENYIVKTTSGEFIIHSMNNIMTERARLTTYKESDTCAWIDRIPPRSIFWDIGANIGMFTLYAAARGDLQVLAFEPHPGNYYATCMSVIENGFSERCTVYPLALYEKEFLGLFKYSSVEIGAAMNVFDRDTDVHGDTFNPQASMGAIGMTVDYFVQVMGALAPQYIKLDVDGNELSILKGARKALKETVREVFVETYEGTAESSDLIDALLVESGFREQGREAFGKGVHNRHYVRVEAPDRLKK